MGPVCQARNAAGSVVVGIPNIVDIPPAPDRVIAGGTELLSHKAPDDIAQVRRDGVIG